MIRVFIADDHPIVRIGLRALLSTAPDIEITGEAEDGRGVLLASEAPDWPVDVLLLDVSLPKVNGIEVLRRLQARASRVAVLIVSMHAEAQYARQLIKLGAAGYVSKDRSDEELIVAIRAVARGRMYVSRQLSVEHGQPLPHEQLSARQLQVFSLLVAGRSVSEIAAELDLTVSTVSTHLGHTKRKLGVGTVAELVHYAHRMKVGL